MTGDPKFDALFAEAQKLVAVTEDLLAQRDRLATALQKIADMGTTKYARVTVHSDEANIAIAALEKTKP